MASASASALLTSNLPHKTRNLPLFPNPNNPHHTSQPFPFSAKFPFPNTNTTNNTNIKISEKWRNRVSFFPSFLKKKGKDSEALKEELLEAISPLDRGAEASPDDKDRVDQIARELEAVNVIKEPLKSDLLNGKWELIYTTSQSILGTQRPKFLRPNGKIYQAINADTLRAQNMETWPFFNQVTANLVPLNARRVAVRFDTFKIAGFIPIKAPGRGRGELEITYLDKEFRISRGDKGNLFILKMVDPTYRVPL
ncbi:putative plastid-lipid-associated protein 4, chloroplastic isoform X1 [Cinnamomum micranthum f. kanehirae]|uniref:Putative plastid-lipid-associated protein 4, chloroplastic isoform X1 n=1 Tax=Cinnamomum micranthum f. kanehirae TaxID=337451 RepID=A0A443PQ34_9MAGN|nr:putative plastid-lipid-associated protein 4, chloroplastic isoform X1 [Cinnamomum micranthum f. kanehirae]